MLEETLEKIATSLEKISASLEKMSSSEIKIKEDLFAEPELEQINSMQEIEVENEVEEEVKWEPSEEVKRALKKAKILTATDSEDMAIEGLTNFLVSKDLHPLSGLEDLAQQVIAFKKEKPVFKWNPMNEPVKNRYSQQQRKVLIDMLTADNYTVGGNEASKELHEILLQREKEQDDLFIEEEPQQEDVIEPTQETQEYSETEDDTEPDSEVSLDDLRDEAFLFYSHQVSLGVEDSKAKDATKQILTQYGGHPSTDMIDKENYAECVLQFKKRMEVNEVF